MGYVIFVNLAKHLHRAIQLPSAGIGVRNLKLSSYLKLFVIQAFGYVKVFVGVYQRRVGIKGEIFIENSFIKIK